MVATKEQGKKRVTVILDDSTWKYIATLAVEAQMPIARYVRLMLEDLENNHEG